MGRLADHLRFPEPDPDTQWAGIVARRRAHARVRKWRGVVAVAAVLATLAVLLVPRESPNVLRSVSLASFAPLAWRSPDPGAWLDARPQGGERTALRLADGSMVHTGPDTRVGLCRARAIDDCVALERGTATISAKPRRAGMLRVRAGRVEVRVIGTRFSVARSVSSERDDVRVEVQEGKVEVTADGRAVQVLGAGDAWSLSTRRERATPPRDPWDEARRLARAGSHREAAQAYATFIARHRDDSRVPLAALELARIRMDVLGDDAGALAPLQRAARSPGVVQEDAQARWVRALEALGRHDECVQQRAVYLRRFPDGLHRRAVERACPNSSRTP